MLPLCHQASETTVLQVHAGGGSKVGGGSKAPTAPPPTPPRKGGERLRTGVAAKDECVVMADDLREPFTTEKTAFSCGENSVFLRRKRFLHRDGRNLRAATPLPFGEGLGVGLLELCCHLPPCCHHLFSPLYKGILGRWWQSGSKNRKKFFSYVTRHIIAQQHSTAAATTQLIDSYETAHRNQRNSTSAATIRHSTDCTKHQKCAQSG